jgi:hypothetical protein
LCKELAGVKILQFSSPLFFLNKDTFKESVLKKCIGGQKFRGNPSCEYGPVRIVIVDCSAMSFIDSAGVATIIEVCPPTLKVMISNSECLFERRFRWN